MRISKVAKKSMAVAMAMAVAVGSVAVAPTKDASAASRYITAFSYTKKCLDASKLAPDILLLFIVRST